jgi:hypothetical protein
MQITWKGLVMASCNLLHRHVLGWCKGFRDHISHHTGCMRACARTLFYLATRFTFTLRPFFITSETVGHSAM